jgi:hypothetical protein
LHARARIVLRPDVIVMRAALNLEVVVPEVQRE